MKRNQFLFSLCIAFVAIGYTLKDVSLWELLHSFQRVNFIYLLPMTLFIWAEYFVRAWRWKILVSPTKKVSTMDVFSPLMIGMIGNLLPMRAGEILRAYLLKQRADIPFSSSLASIMVERTFDLLMLLFLFVSILGLQMGDVKADVGGRTLSLNEMKVSFGVFGAVTLLFLFGILYSIVFHGHHLVPLVRKVVSFLPEHWEHKAKHLIKSFVSGLDIFKDFRSLVKVFIYSALNLIFIILSYYPLFFAFDLQYKTLKALLILSAIIPIFITLFPTPGFVGSVQAGAFFALHEIMNENPVASAGYGMVIWGWGLFVQISMAMIFIFYEHLSIGQVINMETSGEEALEKLD